MDHCPVPNGYDLRRIGPRIDTELKNLGYNGPLTIIAVGNLDGIPYDFLEALSSTLHAGVGSIGYGLLLTRPGMFDVVLLSESLDEPPVTVMLISESSILKSLTRDFCLREGRYNLLLAYQPRRSPDLVPHPSFMRVSGEWLWNKKSLLKDSPEETKRLDRGCEMFSCRSCYLDFPTFDDFTTHLRSSSEHAREIELANRDSETAWKHSVARMEELKQSQDYRDLVRALDLEIQEFENLLPTFHHTAKPKKKQSKASKRTKESING